MLFSIIVPTFNEEAALEGTLQAIKKLTKVSYEVIVADSGSTDNTVAIAHRYADKVVAYNDLPRNFARGRNLGASVASGDFFVFVDADVTICGIDDFFWAALSAFFHSPELVAIAPRVEILPSVRTFADDISYRLLNRITCAFNNHLHRGIAPGDLQLMRAAAFRQIGGYEEKLQIGEDIEFYKRLAKVGKVRYRTDMVVMHPGRRPHAIGWLRLWRDWLLNGLSVRLRGRPWDHEWKVVR